MTKSCNIFHDWQIVKCREEELLNLEDILKNKGWEYVQKNDRFGYHKKTFVYRDNSEVIKIQDYELFGDSGLQNLTCYLTTKVCLTCSKIKRNYTRENLEKKLDSIIKKKRRTGETKYISKEYTY